MPSPYGPNRNVAQYYQYGGVPQHYVYNWQGMPAPAVQHSGSADLSGLGCYEKTVLAGDDYIDVIARAQFHKTLGDDASVGDYPTWPVAMTMETARRSVRHSGPEQTPLDDRPSLGGFSDNEKTALGVLAAAGVGYLLWKKYGRKGRRK